MANKQKVSQKFTFTGWSFWEWVKGNKKTIKEVVKVGLPILVSTYIASQIWQNFLITIVGKFILDSIDYWVSD